MIGPEVRVIDFYENHGQHADHYCGVVSARGYLQGKDFVPHDAKVHEWGTGKTQLETLIALGRKPVLVPEHKIEDGINAAHMMFKRVWFDEAKCAAGLEALRQYRCDYDEKLRAFKKTPKEDWTCDAADAFRYVAMAWREIVKVPEPPKKRLFIPMEEITMDQLI